MQRRWRAQTQNERSIRRPACEVPIRSHWRACQRSALATPVCIRATRNHTQRPSLGVHRYNWVSNPRVPLDGPPDLAPRSNDVRHTQSHCGRASTKCVCIHPARELGHQETRTRRLTTNTIRHTGSTPRWAPCARPHQAPRSPPAPGHSALAQRLPHDCPGARLPVMVFRSPRPHGIRSPQTPHSRFSAIATNSHRCVLNRIRTRVGRGGV